mmetsp:Transcript_17672/g.29864  ORF Transcript_17672/g.29864 Transcript_17672/m.29864 type:complete len:85 (+) Transcript_17672:697-951(+)
MHQQKLDSLQLSLLQDRKIKQLAKQTFGLDRLLQTQQDLNRRGKKEREGMQAHFSKERGDLVGKIDQVAELGVTGVRETKLQSQ